MDNPIAGQSVRNIFQNFNGKVLKEDFNDYWIITPDSTYLQNLYPYGIRTHKDNLTDLKTYENEKIHIE